MNPISYGALDLKSPELYATGADYVTITQPLPTVTFPVAANAPYNDDIGNVAAEPFVSQVAPEDRQDLLAAAQAVIAAYPAGDTITLGGAPLNNVALTYGSPTDPKLVVANGNLRLRNGSTFTGFGILAVETTLEIRDSTFNWTGMVLLTGANPTLWVRNGSIGTILGSILASPTAGQATINVDRNASVTEFSIRYSCDALDLAASAAPVQTLSWIALHQ